MNLVGIVVKPQEGTVMSFGKLSSVEYFIVLEIIFLTVASER
jgi:hypothetical protein